MEHVEQFDFRHVCDWVDDGFYLRGRERFFGLSVTLAVCWQRKQSRRKTFGRDEINRSVRDRRLRTRRPRPGDFFSATQTIRVGWLQS